MQFFKSTLLITILFLIAGSAVANNDNTVTADYIIEQINQGIDIDIRNKTIIGDLDFSKLKSQNPGGSYGVMGGKVKEYIGTVQSKIYFKNCRFEGTIQTYSESKKGNLIKHNFTKFVNALSFDDCVFDAPVHFEKTSISGKVKIINSVFKSKLRFYNVHFDIAPVIQNNDIQGVLKNKHTNWEQELGTLKTKKQDEQSRYITVVLKNTSLKAIPIDFGKTRWNLSPMGTSTLNVQLGQQVLRILKGNEEKLLFIASPEMDGKTITLKAE